MDCTPVRHQPRRRSTCTPPRKPSAKHGRNVMDTPDTNVITYKRTNRQVRRALAFTQGIATPPLSAKSRAAVLSALRGRGAAMRLDFDNVCEDATTSEACKQQGDEQVSKMKGNSKDGTTPAGSVTPPPTMVCVLIDWRNISQGICIPGCVGSASRSNLTNLPHAHRQHGTSDVSLRWHKTAMPTSLLHLVMRPRSRCHPQTSTSPARHTAPSPPRPPMPRQARAPMPWQARPTRMGASAACGDDPTTS